METVAQPDGGSQRQSPPQPAGSARAAADEASEGKESEVSCALVLRPALPPIGCALIDVEKENRENWKRDAAALVAVLDGERTVAHVAL